MNPYAPPVPPPPPEWQGGSTGPVPWSATGVLGRAWEAYKFYAILVSLAFFVAVVIGQIPGVVTQVALQTGAVAPRSTSYQVLNLGMTVLGWLIGVFFEGGMACIALKVARGQEPKFGDVFTGARWFLPMVVMGFLRTLIIGLGLVLLIVPGIIASLGLVLSPFYIVDQELGPVEALGASWQATKGQKGEIFVLSLLGGLLMLLGFCALGVGFLVALPVVQTATALAYLHMAGRLPPSADGPPYGAAPPAPPGTYGGYVP
jgi:hypothetical protein